MIMGQKTGIYHNSICNTLLNLFIEQLITATLFRKYTICSLDEFS